MYNNSNDCSGESGSGCGSAELCDPRCLVLHADALSAVEWNYILGLFLTDGAAFVSRDGRGWRRYRVQFYLQGNEGEVVERLVGMMRRAGMNPHIMFPKKKYSIVVEMHSKALLGFIPDKAALKENAGARERFFSEHRLRELCGGIPFIAGLIDGDGSTRVYVKFRSSEKKRFRDVQQWRWSFVQRKYPFLVYYLKEFVDSLAPSSTRLYEWADGTRQLAICKSGMEALLSAGIAEYSWKAEEWLRNVAKVRVRLEEFYTTKQVAEMFKVTVATVNNWLNAGKMNSKRGSEVNGKASQRYIPHGEVQTLRRRCAKIAEKTGSEAGMRLVDVAQMLSVKENTLRARYLRGKLQATLVRESIGQVWRNLVIPRDEVEHLKEEKTRFGRRPRPG